jgi:hypothetical protein
MKRPPSTFEELRAAVNTLNHIEPAKPAALSVVGNQKRLPVSDALRMMKAAPTMLVALKDAESTLLCLTLRLRAAIEHAEGKPGKSDGAV